MGTGTYRDFEGFQSRGHGREIVVDGPHGGSVVLVLAVAAKLPLQLQGKMGTLPALAPRIIHHLLQLEYRLGDGSEGALDMLAEYDLLPVEFVNEVRELAPEMRIVPEGVVAVLVVLEEAEDQRKDSQSDADSLDARHGGERQMKSIPLLGKVGTVPELEDLAGDHGLMETWSHGLGTTETERVGKPTRGRRATAALAMPTPLSMPVFQTTFSPEKSSAS